MAALEHIVSRNLQCPVCLELLSDPKQLSCSHTFCKKCIGDILICSVHKNENILACPICRDDTTVKSGDVVNLRTNFPLKALVDDLKNSQQLCEICDSKSKATHFCCECGKNMCKSCLENHNKLPLNHKVLSVDEIREGKVVLESEIYCQDHPPSERRKHVCTDVCTTCKKFICLRCRMLNHEKKGHTVQDAEEYKASIKTEMGSLQARAKTKATTVKKHQTCIESQKQRVNDHIDGRKAAIDKIYQDSIKKINERKAALDMQLETQRGKLCKRLDEMKDADERLVASIESASELVGNSLKVPLDANTVHIHDSLSGDLKKVLNRDDPQEKLATDVADRAEQLKFTPNNKLDQLNIGEVKFVKCELECDVELSKKDEMNAMAATPDGRMAVGYGSGGIDIYNGNGKLQQTVLNDVKILGIGFLTDGRYTALDKLNNTITLYTQEQVKLDVRFESLSHDEGGIGNLTVDSNDLIYVSYRKPKKIQVFSPEGGKAIREIPCDGYVPCQITSCNDLLVVSDTLTIRIIDQEGNVKHKIDKPEHYSWAAVTQNDTILIAWVKHDDGLVSIDEYTNDLKHIKNLITDQKIEKPEKRRWYYLQELKSGEIAFCTPDRLYIFKLTITPTNV